MADPATNLILTPAGHVLLSPSEDDTATLPETIQHRLQQAFSQSAAHGLLELGLREVGTVLPPTFAFWRDFAAHYVTALCMTSDVADDKTSAASGKVAPAPVPAPSQEDLDNLVATAPPKPGGEYLNTTVLDNHRTQNDAACRES